MAREEQWLVALLLARPMRRSRVCGTRSLRAGDVSCSTVSPSTNNRRVRAAHAAVDAQLRFLSP